MFSDHSRISNTCTEWQDIQRHIACANCCFAACILDDLSECSCAGWILCSRTSGFATIWSNVGGLGSFKSTTGVIQAQSFIWFIIDHLVTWPFLVVGKTSCPREATLPDPFPSSAHTVLLGSESSFQIGFPLECQDKPWSHQQYFKRLKQKASMSPFEQAQTYAYGIVAIKRQCPNYTSPSSE